MAPSPHQPAGDYLTKQDVARLLKVSVRTVERHVALGKLPPPIRFSQRCLRWRRQAIEDYLARLGPQREAARKRRTG